LDDRVARLACALLTVPEHRDRIDQLGRRDFRRQPGTGPSPDLRPPRESLTTPARISDVLGLTWGGVRAQGTIIHPAKTRHSTGDQAAIKLTQDIQAGLQYARAFGRLKGLSLIYKLIGIPHTCVCGRANGAGTCVPTGRGHQCPPA